MQWLIYECLQLCYHGNFFSYPYLGVTRSIISAFKSVFVICLLLRFTLPQHLECRQPSWISCFHRVLWISVLIQLNASCYSAWYFFPIFSLFMRHLNMLEKFIFMKRKINFNRFITQNILNQTEHCQIAEQIWSENSPYICFHTNYCFSSSKSDK